LQLRNFKGAFTLGGFAARFRRAARPLPLRSFRRGLPRDATASSAEGTASSARLEAAVPSGAVDARAARKSGKMNHDDNLLLWVLLLMKQKKRSKRAQEAVGASAFAAAVRKGPALHPIP